MLRPSKAERHSAPGCGRKSLKIPIRERKKVSLWGEINLYSQFDIVAEYSEEKNAFFFWGKVQTTYYLDL
jgi:hypothetical protein